MGTSPAEDGPSTFVPFSYGQQGVLLERARRPPGSFNFQVRVPLDPAPPDERSVRHLLDAVQARHDAFRAVAVTRRGRSGLEFQEDGPPLPVEFEEVSDARAWMYSPFRRGADLLVKSRVIERRGTTWLHLAVDHLVIDGWSVGVLSADVETMWRAVVEGAVAPPPPGSFRDYLVAQRADASHLEGYRRFWRQQFAASGSLQLARRELDGGCVVVFALPPRVAERLPAAKRRFGTTDFCIMLAALATVLVRRTSQPSVMIRTIVADRGRPDTIRTVGCLLNYVGVRFDVDGQFARTVQSGHSSLLEALQHQVGPFFDVASEGDRDGAVVFAQPRMFEPRSWLPPEPGGRSVQSVQHTASPFLGDISFTYQASAAGYEAGLGVATAFVDNDEAVALAEELVDVLDVETAAAVGDRRAI